VWVTTNDLNHHMVTECPKATPDLPQDADVDPKAYIEMRERNL